MAKDTSYRSLNVVFNNPREHGYEGTERAICEALRSEWCFRDSRRGAWAFCKKYYRGHFPIYDGNGKLLRYQLAVTEEEKKLVPPDLEHIHMVLEDDNPIKISQVINTYAKGAHFEISKGNKRQAEDYICKTGEYDEKANKENGYPYEEVICVVRKGEIQGRQGQRSDIQNIASLLAEGKTPREILETAFGYYRYEAMIRSAYFDKRDRETPPERQLKVIWHTGLSGSGKSYFRMELIKREGEDRIFYLSTFGSGMFDKYNGEPILWIEDFKGEIKFGDFLRYLDIYKCELPARFKNGKALWTEVHITSVLHPLGAYNRMLKEKDKAGDSADQLLRRIFCIRYHWKDDSGYHWRDFPTSYGLETMRKICVEGLPDDGTMYTDPEIHQSQFETLDEDEQLPF